MSDWTSGYVADIGYTYGYYSELNPIRAKFALLNAGYVAPSFENACELGFGQGISINMHSAASPVKWVGTDFNPSQAAFAMGLAKASQNDASLFDQSFEEFHERSDLPDFDFIGLHGIWSWISDGNRALIVDFVRRRLRVGGVLYVSYNTLPGWSTFSPIRHLLTEHARVASAPGTPTASRVDQSIEFVQKVLDVQPAYSRAVPQVDERFSRMKAQNRNYLAHEYFNRDWHPMYFSTMADWLEPAKVQFACSANLIDHMEPANLTLDQRNLLKGIPDETFRQSVRDFLVNQQFRRDLWIRGSRSLSAIERQESLNACRVVLGAPRAQVPGKFSTSMGEVTLNAGVADAILDLLADHNPREIGEIALRLKAAGISNDSVQEVVSILVGLNRVHPAQDAQTSSACRSAAHQLNRTLLHRARAAAETAYLVSPVTGGGHDVSRFAQLFLAARLEGLGDPVDCARAVWNVIGPQGQRLVSNGKPLVSEQENLEELHRMAADFFSGQFPVLQALDVLPV